VPTFRTGTVREVLEQRTGLQRVRVDLGGPEPERAYALTDLTGTVAAGDRVVVNTTAVDLGLGTGGWHVIHWNLERGEWSEPGPGHIIKLRYTSLQADTGSDEEHRDDLPDNARGLVVVACTVHSQVPGVAAAFKKAHGGRVAYVMTDGAALPIVISDLVVAMRESGLVDATVTAGHAFGGDLEAVTVPAALVLARHALHADLAIVGMGPGVVGTGTGLGTTAVEAAAVLDSAAALGAEPVLALRVSDADQRERHRGLSHHSATVLDLVRSPVHVAAHPWLGDQPRHDVREVEQPDTPALLETAGVAVTTMGRGPEEEPSFFAAAGAAGVLAAGFA